MDGGDYERARPRSRSRSPDARRVSSTSYRQRSRSRSRSRDRSSRRRSRSRSPRDRRDHRDRDRDRDRRHDDRHRRDDAQYPGASTRGGYGGGRSSRGPPVRDSTERAANREAVAQDAIRNSKKENRVYIGNLSFQVRWHDLKDFCSAAGTVVFSEIIQLPNGMSKGCGIVEYSTNEEAQRAIRELNEGQLFGRPAFLREDREDEARFGAAAVSGRTTFPGASHQSGGGGGHRGRSEVGVPAVFAPPGPRGLFVTGMTPEIGWQDLKDLFRRAGEVQRADINMDHSTNTSKGTGVVVMSSRAEADEAIAMFNGYEFEGGRLEVREDRFFHINQARSALGPPRGGRPSGRGGFSGSHASSRSTDNLYNDYAGPSDSMSSRCGGDDFGSGSERLSYSGFSGRAPPTGPYAGRDPIQASPSTQIFVNNLPWSTSNEDLVELFQTTGTVEEAEIIWEGGRSKGNGIVQFATIDEAETAIAKFQGYQYGGRPLRLAFNARWKDFKEGGSRALKDEQATAVGENGADNYDMGDNVGPADYDTYKEVVPADEAMQA